MSDTTTFQWFYDLFEYALTSDVTNDYVAKVHTTKTLTISDIASSIASDRTDLREDTIIMVLNLFADKLMQQVCSGYIVNANFCIVRPLITGVFSGKDSSLSDANKLKIGILPTTTFRSMLDDVETEFTGNFNEYGGAYISTVLNENTKLSDGVITPGALLTITGNKIKCVNEDGSDFGQILFLNTETNESVAATVIGTNEPKTVTCLVPSDLPAGSYTLLIVTYFSGSSTLLKNSRSLEYSESLIVE